MRLLTAAPAAATLVAAAALLAAPSAQALTPQTVFGTVTCQNSAQQKSRPTGAWVVSEKGESGPSKLSDGGGHSWTQNYTFTTYDAGRFRVVVGCGGTAQAPGKAVVTDWMNPGRHNLTMNF
ncbi:hypothetical protein FK531_10065 [Rhodococcus spelaei]|uniref:Uncharacterized protein n=1 Tax=Rhodococcus spelaei TaxID=2546320 RepID=A0A541B9U3_9NOCA|nr:hypothetical protein [Rhodococcus spelaei]TQF69106.1 hypothetical protein FK531_10065 [Rhodococcus spelaei]